MYLSAVLKRAGYKDVSLIHMDADDLNEAEIAAKVIALNPDLVGLSSITSESYCMYALAKKIKNILNNVCVIAGGPHPTAYVEDCLKNDAIDIVVKGEGEETLLEIVRTIEKKEPLGMIKGISYKENGGILHNPPREYVADIDQLPYPDWGAVNIDAYKRFIPQSPFMYQRKYMTIFTSRGCPFHCTYCHNVMGKSFRAHSVNRVFDEVSYLHNKYGIRHVAIIDDIFNWDRTRSLAIMQRIADSEMKLAIHFANGIKGDLLDEEQIKIFAKAGLSFTCVAVETGSMRLQKKIKKGIDFPKIRENIALLSKHRIFVNGYFIIGFPGETFKEVLLTIWFACTSKLHTASFFVYHAYKGTELGDDLSGEIVSKVQNSASSYTTSSDFVNCSSLSKSAIVFLRQFANICFYGNPVRVFRILRDLPDYGAFYILLKKLIHRTIFLK
ncbi:MAG: hypothetical protein A2270_09690 [Elusimicrobia bacterium RIFOXYA12_FULL_51_18]|nr:MAG: hypothetical protein A2270_09690 [Elusimicrobia bacterium RIFOXYA12_FULL_51_18]OGS32774.1 MAG: hypothetical protein A2218_12005 [Elusimicrobia bacterium RIFOXYA2_FULL_53_38]